MSKISYVNGRYVQHQDAFVHMEDRGYQFGDGVYEVMAFYNRKMLDGAPHMQRLTRSLKETRIAPPMSEKALQMVINELIARNSRIDGTIYLQITRGVAKRDHIIPGGMKSALTMTVTGPKIPKAKDVSEGISVATVEDIRWHRRDIKTVLLLPNTFAKREAMEKGAREAWMVSPEGMITEASASNAYIVNAKGEIVTHPANQWILNGITRMSVLQIARKAGYKIVERPFSVKEAKAAKEAFITGTTSNVLPIVSIDGAKIGNGKPGPVAQDLLKHYHAYIYEQTGKEWI